MTERLYYTDPALTEFEATITRLEKSGEQWEVLLDRSAFYPTSGGQQADRGTLGGAPVIDVREDDSGAVVHVLTAAPGELGMAVYGSVDAVRRLRHRQQHSAQHILSQVFIRLFDMATVSVHLGDAYGAIEMTGEMPTDELLAAAEFEANQIVFENKKVTIRFVTREEAARLPMRKIPDRDGPIRLIQIGEFDYSACGGTHCLSTAEVGPIKITGATRQRGNVLVTFLAGRQALDDYQLRFRVSEQLATELTCHFEDIPGRVSKLAEELKQTRLQLGAVQREHLPVVAQRLATTATGVGADSLVFAALPEFDAKTAGLLLAMVVERTGGVAAATVEQRLLIAANPTSGQSANGLVKEICAATGLRGGGSSGAAQIGGVTVDRSDELAARLRELLGHA